jgi:processing peptidase subunit alpha
MALGPTPFPNLAHLMLGFEGVSVKHDDFVAFCVLQSLLGGGGSFRFAFQHYLIHLLRLI